MKSRLLAKLRRWRRRMERRQQREEIYRMYESGIITPREMWEALQSWQSVGTGAGYVNLERDGYLEVVQTGYTYIFQMANMIRPAEREEEEQRIKKALAAGVLVLDARASLVDVKPRLKTVVNKW